MALVEIARTLADATLSNGASLVTAGGGLPQRITTEEYILDLSGDISNQIVGLLFGNDDRSIIVAASSMIRKYSLAGALLNTITQSSCWGLWRWNSDTILVGRNINATTYYELTESTWTATAPALGTSANARLVFAVPGGTADRIWRSSGTVVEEFVRSTGAATGRSIAVVHNAVSASDADGVPGIYLSTGGTTVTKYRESDLTVEKTWTTAGNARAPGTQVGTELHVDPTGRPVVFNGGPVIDRLDLAGGAQKDVAERYIWSGPEIGGSGAPQSGGGNQTQLPIGWSSDGRYVAYLTNSPDQTAARRAVRIKNLLQQRARWAVPVAANGLLKRIAIPGHLGGQLGVSDTGWRAGTTLDFRRARCFYSLNGGGSRVEFTPNAPLAVAVTAGQTITFDVDLYSGPGVPGGPAPWVAGDNGEGPTVYMAVADPRRRLAGSI